MESDGFYSIIDYEVDGPGSQRELVDAFVELQERWVRFYPGYRSARIFASVDGRRIYNVVHWASEEDYRRFEATSDTAGRSAAIQAAVDGVSGWAEPRMTGAPRFRLARQVGPGPQRTDAVGSAGAGSGDRTEDRS
jgi:C-6 monooxygenase